MCPSIEARDLAWLQSSELDPLPVDGILPPHVVKMVKITAMSALERRARGIAVIADPYFRSGSPTRESFVGVLSPTHCSGVK